MCAILGIISNGLTEEHYNSFIDAWTDARNRGTDACGWIAADKDNIYWWKNAEPSDEGSRRMRELFPYRQGIRFMLGHTRFATSGHPSDNLNNHPLIIGADKNLLGIHNGVIYNKSELLETESITSDRDVDTEIAFRMIAKYGLKSLKPMEMMRGSFNLAYCTRKYTDRFWLVRHDNPLTIRRGKDYIAFGSLSEYWASLAGKDFTPRNDTRMLMTAKGWTSERFKPAKEPSWNWAWKYKEPERSYDAIAPEDGQERPRVSTCGLSWDGRQRTLYWDPDTRTFETKKPERIWPGEND